MLKALKYTTCILLLNLLIFLAPFLLSIPYAHAEETKRLLFKACKKGDLETVKRLVGNGLSVESRDDSKSSLLGIAARLGHVEMVKFLLDKGAKIDDISSVNRTPLMKASGFGHFEIVKLLIERGADINWKNSFGETALALASTRGSPEIVKFLLENGADIKSEDRTGRTAFIIACTSGHLQVANILLEYDSSIRSQKNMLSKTLINSSIGKNVEEILDFLIELGADINYSGGGQLGWTALIEVSVNGKKEAVQLLLKKGARVDTTDNSGNTALLHAAKYGQIEAMRILLENGANPEHRNLKGETALSLAKNDETVDLLIKYGVKAPIPLTLANFDLLHSLPYDKRLSSGLELAFKQYYRLLTKRPGLLVTVNVSSSKIDIEKYKLIYTLKIKGSSEKYEVILSNRAKDIGENLKTLAATIKKFSKKRQSEWRAFKHDKPGYNKFQDELTELLSRFDYLDVFGALQQTDQHLASGNFGPEVLLSASEIYSWLAFFKNRSQYRKLSDSLAVKAVGYYILGCLGNGAEEGESFSKGLLMLALDYPAFAEESFSGKSEIEKLLTAYIRYDFDTLGTFEQKPFPNRRLLAYLMSRAYKSSDQENVAWSHYKSIALNYPDFLITKGYIIDNGRVGFSRSMIESYMEDLIEKHLAVIDKFSRTAWIEREKDLDRLVKKEVPEERRLEKWLKIHKTVVNGTKSLKKRSYLIDAHFLNDFLMYDMENALLIKHRLEAERLGREAETTAIVDLVKSVYPNSTLGNVLILMGKKDRSRLRGFLRNISPESSDKFLIRAAIKSQLLSPAQRFNFLKVYREKENPDSIGLYRMFEFHHDMFYRPVAISCLKEGTTADPYNYIFYEKIINYKEGKEFIENGKKQIGKLYGFLNASGAWHNKNGDIKEAASCYQAAIERSPSQQSAYLKLGELYHQEKQFEMAIQAWQEYLKHDEHTLSAVEIKNTIGRAWLDKGEVSKAYDIFLESKRSWQAGAMLGFAEASEKTGRILQAEEYFKKAAKRYPTGSCPNRLGQFYLRQGNVDMACQVFREYKRYQRPTNYLYYLADHFSGSGSKKEAIDVVNKVEKISGNRLLRHINILAKAYALQGEYGNAISILEPFAVKGKLVSRYLLYSKEGGVGNPEKVLSSYIKLNSRRPHMNWNLANRCLRLGLFDEALILLMKVIGGKKDEPAKRIQKMAFLNSALAWKISNSDLKTKEEIKSHLKDYSQDPWLTSRVMFLIGDIDEKKILEKARTSKQRAEIYYYLGVIKHKEGKKDDALKCLLIYLEAMDDRQIPYGHAYELAKEIAHKEVVL